MSVYKLQFDGGSRGNPGLAGAGCVLYKNNKVIYKLGKYLEIATNNFAEYTGLLLGLSKAVDLGIKDIIIEGDSMLVVKQISGVYKVNSPTLKVLKEEAIQLLSKFDTFKINHIYRKDNSVADSMANMSMDFKQDFELQ